MLTKTEHYKLLIFFIIITIILVTQYFLSADMELISVPIVETFQSDPYLVKVMRVITQLGSKAFKFYLMCIIFSVCNTYHSFIYTVVCNSSVLICCFVKIILQEPRPFWLHDSIQALECEEGYGYPSNHVMSTVPSYMMFFEIIYYHYEMDRAVNAKLFYWLGISVNVTICMLIGMSRMILGVHSMDQVFFGLLNGFATYYFFLHIIDYDLKDFHPFLQMISNSYQKAKAFVIFIGIYFIFLITIMFIKVEYNPQWTEQILKKCGSLPLMSPFYQCLADSGLYFVLLGTLIGIMYDVNFHFSKGQKLTLEYIYENITDNLLSHPRFENRTGKWNDTSPGSTFLRTILFILLNNVIFMMCRFILSFQENNILTNYIFSKMLPGSLSAFIVFAFGKKLSYHLGISNISKDEQS